jgi:hypothetical protein
MQMLLRYSTKENDFWTPLKGTILVEDMRKKRERERNMGSYYRQKYERAGSISMMS